MIGGHGGKGSRKFAKKEQKKTEAAPKEIKENGGKVVASSSSISVRRYILYVR